MTSVIDTTATGAATPVAAGATAIDTTATGTAAGSATESSAAAGTSATSTTPASTTAKSAAPTSTNALADSTTAEAADVRAPLSDLQDKPQSTASKVLVGVFVAVPLLALIAAIPLAWGWGLGWHDVVLAVAFYYISGLGIAMGFHRYFTHSSFKAKPAMRVALAIAGSLAVEGPVINWVADHRRHHKYSDREGDPHSPWRFGDDWKALAKGLAWAHVGWLFDGDRTSKEKFCPDLQADKKIAGISRLFPVLVAISMLAPALIGGLWAWSWWGALTAFFWATLVRIAFLHHVTWSINSICHTFGKEEFEVRDKSRNVNWLAVLSFGESWHNLHHSDPTCARHGALRGQIDIAARLIWFCEKFGWVYDVRWPDEARLSAKKTGTRRLGSMTRRAAAEPIGRTAA
ncbi:MAG TPA: acyl-CoA desaturase [Streptosporangiaceae bacterium]|nr:acyl-CoA desaturase [Streptosporangiaceae bacterium]